jgi:hypothetical protein
MSGLRIWSAGSPLDASNVRQDHTTSPSAKASLVWRFVGLLTGTTCPPCKPNSAPDAFSVHRIPPRVRDDLEPPLWGMGR